MPLRILLPLTIVTFAVGTDTFVIAGLLPAISQELHVSPTNAGQLVTAFSITFALAAPILSKQLPDQKNQHHGHRNNTED